MCQLDIAILVMHHTLFDGSIATITFRLFVMICYSSLRELGDVLKYKLYHEYGYQYSRHISIIELFATYIFIFWGAIMFEQHFNF